MSKDDQWLLRIKINGFNLLGVSLVKNKDFIFSFPQTRVASYTLNGHFTLHTKYPRITVKTTSITKHFQEILPLIIDQYEDHPGIKGKTIPNGEIDLNKGDILNLDDSTILTRTPIGIGLNLAGIKIEDLFTPKVSKKTDSLFKYIEDIHLPEGRNGFYLYCLIGKNFTGKVKDYIKNADYYFVLQKENYCKDIYTILFLMDYTFPKIKYSDNALKI
jgi:hypothetical protein